MFIGTFFHLLLSETHLHCHQVIIHSVTNIFYSLFLRKNSLMIGRNNDQNLNMWYSV